MKFCASCGEVWMARARRADALFCSDKCRQRGCRARKASGETASRRATGGPWLASTPIGPSDTGKPPEAAPAPILGVSLHLGLRNRMQENQWLRLGHDI